MNKQSIRNILILMTFSSIFVACSTSSNLAPTHYWQAKEAKTGRDFRVDNRTCHEEFGIEEATPLPSESPSFEAYSHCMIEKGYVLRTY